jgi:1-acyl-sn-glycerol-3-phosphate acyltransferase
MEAKKTIKPIRKPSAKLSFKIAYSVFVGIFKVLTRLDIRGRENMPQEGPLIVVFNHLNLIDPVLHIMSIVPRRDIIVMAKKELFKWWPIPIFRILMDIAEAFPVARFGTSEERQKAIDHAELVVEQGYAFGIYPEGTRSKLGHLKEAYHGVALIALHTGAPLIPVCIWGTEKLKGKGWLSRPKVIVNFGKPFRLPSIEGEPTSEQLKELTELTMRYLATYLPTQYRGRYAPLELPTKTKTLVHA